MLKIRNCKVIHNPPHSYGDCIRACLASLADDDDTPHLFGTHSSNEAWNAVQRYLKSKGKNLILFPIEADKNPFDFMLENNQEVPYMLLARTLTGDHAVLCINDEILRDPSVKGPQKIIGPHSSGFWIIGVVGGRL